MAFGSVADEVLASTPPQALPAAVVRERASAKWETLRAIAQSIIPMQEPIRDMLRACGGPVTAKELGLSRDDVHDALRYAMMIRPRPTVMRIAHAWGVHEQICDEVMEKIDV
jgi:glycerol dehydrogenase-like iron-containing ADH family enzyme